MAKALAQQDQDLVEERQGDLICDGDMAVLYFCKAIFQDNGFMVDTTQSRVERLEMSTRTRYDVLLCDWKMPGFDRLDVVTEIEIRTADSAVVMFSGYQVFFMGDPSPSFHADGQTCSNFLLNDRWGDRPVPQPGRAGSTCACWQAVMAVVYIKAILNSAWPYRASMEQARHWPAEEAEILKNLPPACNSYFLAQALLKIQSTGIIITIHQILSIIIEYTQANAPIKIYPSASNIVLTILYNPPHLFLFALLCVKRARVLKLQKLSNSGPIPPHIIWCSLTLFGMIEAVCGHCACAFLPEFGEQADESDHWRFNLYTIKADTSFPKRPIPLMDARRPGKGPAGGLKPALTYHDQ